MRKIVFFTANLSIGGIEQVLLTYARLFIANGYSVTYVVATDNIYFDIKAIPDLKLVNLGCKRLREATFAFTKYLKTEKPEYIFTANDATLLCFVANMLNLNRSKIITSQHNYIKTNKEVGLAHSLIIRFVYPFCSNTIAVSKGIEDLLHQMFWINSNKIIQIYNPIDIDKIENMSQLQDADLDKYNDFIVFVGRLSIVKNLIMLIKAFAKLDTQSKLLIIGDGDMYGKLLDLIKDLRLTNKVFLLGSKKNPYPFIKKAKCLVLSSVSEALPTVLLEALSLGTPVVSTPNGGAIEIIHNEKLGVIAQSFSEDDLCLALNQCLQGFYNKQNLKDEVMSNYSLNSRYYLLKKILR